MAGALPPLEVGSCPYDNLPMNGKFQSTPVSMVVPAECHEQARFVCILDSTDLKPADFRDLADIARCQSGANGHNQKVALQRSNHDSDGMSSEAIDCRDRPRDRMPMSISGEFDGV